MSQRHAFEALVCVKFLLYTIAFFYKFTDDKVQTVTVTADFRFTN